MNPEIIYPIVGTIIGTLITALTTIVVAKIEKSSTTASDTESSILTLHTYKPRPRKPDLRFTIALFAAGAFVGGVLGYLWSLRINSPTPTFSSAPTRTPIPCSFYSKSSIRHAFPPGNLTGTITSPGHCETGLLASRYSPITVEGSMGQIPNKTHVWLLVYGPDGKYYPQCNTSPATKADCTVSGEWSMRAYLGSECKPYLLVLVSTNNDGTTFLLNTMDDWERSGSYTGLRSEELKQYEIKELDSVQVETGVCATQTLTP
jgi:hypothetical protein